MRRYACHCRRSGLSLLEVILSLAILMIGMLLIGQLIEMGIRSAAGARDQSRAQLLCESKLAELTALGVVPRVQSQVPLADQPDWSYSIDVQPYTGMGIVELTVTVAPRDATRQEEGEFTLTRWIVDSAAMQQAASQP